MATTVPAAAAHGPSLPRRRDRYPPCVHDRGQPDSAPGATAGWHADPFGRHEFRYHNGASWTGDVADSGMRSIDPPVWSGAGIAAPRDGAAIAALVLGIIGVCLAWLPFLVVLGALASVGALIAARRARARTVRRTGQLRAGRILGFVGLVLVIPGIVLTRVALGLLHPGPHTVEITSCESSSGRAVMQASITNLSDDGRGYLVLVRFSRAGTGSVVADTVVQIDDVAPGASETFATAVTTDVTGVECEIVDVLGGLPVSID